MDVELKVYSVSVLIISVTLFFIPYLFLRLISATLCNFCPVLREGRGLFEEIPDAYYSGNQLVEDFSIPELIPGEYKLEFFGLYNEKAYAVIGDRENGVLIGFNEEYKRNNPDPPPFILPIPVPPKQDVPEPGAVLGLIGLGIMIIARRKK